MRMVPLLFLAAGIAGRCADDRLHGHAQALSVCALLSGDVTKFNGRIISVEGQLGASYHGLYLRGTCKTHLVTKGIKWGDDISVEPDSTDSNGAQSWEKMSKEFKRLHVDLKRDKVMVTIVGRLETRDSLDAMVVQGPSGPVPFGFGHMNGSPAAISVVRFRINEVVR